LLDVLFQLEQGKVEHAAVDRAFAADTERLIAERDSMLREVERQSHEHLQLLAQKREEYLLRLDYQRSAREACIQSAVMLSAVVANDADFVEQLHRRLMTSPSPLLMPAPLEPAPGMSRTSTSPRAQPVPTFTPPSKPQLQSHRPHPHHNTISQPPTPSHLSSWQDALHRNSQRPAKALSKSNVCIIM
jgi:hypothetical protein